MTHPLKIRLFKSQKNKLQENYSNNYVQRLMI